MSNIVYVTDQDMGLPTLLEGSRVPSSARVRAVYTLGGSGPIYYELISTKIPGLVIEEDTGILSGIISEMDDWVDEFVEEIVPFTNENYATFGSAKLYDGANARVFRASFVVRAYQLFNPENYTDGEFYFKLRNNWSSDRNKFLSEYDTTFLIDGEPVSNSDYLRIMQERGYFEN